MRTKNGGRYVANEVIFFEDANTALKSQIANRKGFNTFYNSLPSDEKKGQFLRVASFYLGAFEQGVVEYFRNVQ